MDARWTLKRARKPEHGSKPKVEIAVPVFGYKNQSDRPGAWLHPLIHREQCRRS